MWKAGDWEYAESPFAVVSAPLKPSSFLCYIDNTFVVWLHGLKKLKESL